MLEFFDASMIEVINLLSAGLTSFNAKPSVTSDLSADHLFLPTQNIITQDRLDRIEDWTTRNEMILNSSKTKYLIFNTCKNFQFDTRLYLSDTILDRVRETKLLGVIINEDLTWHSNTRYIVNRAYQRMIILRYLFSFNVPKKEMITIYILYIISIVEQSCVVWGSSLTQDEENYIERVQKCSLRLIFRENYISYENCVNKAKILTLKNRRTLLQYRFASRCTQNEKTKDMFPLKQVNRLTRHPDIYEVPFARTSRLADSALVSMARLLNEQKKTSK